MLGIPMYVCCVDNNYFLCELLFYGRINMCALVGQESDHIEIMGFIEYDYFLIDEK